MRLSPAHPFAQEDTTDLAAFDRDARLFGGLGQRSELAVISDRQATSSSRFRLISQPFDALRIETVQSTPHRLRATLQFLRNGFHPLPIPTTHHHACMDDPVCWPMSACCQLPYLALFLLSLCRIFGICLLLSSVVVLLLYSITT